LQPAGEAEPDAQIRPDRAAFQSSAGVAIKGRPC